MEKKIVLKVALYVFAMTIGFVVTFLIASGYFKEKFTKKNNEQEIKIKTYALNDVTLPLKDVKQLNYVTDKEITIANKTNNYSYKLYIDSNNNLVIKNNNTGKETIAKSVSNVKYIIKSLPLYALTNDGALYYHELIDSGIEGADSLSANDIDKFKKINKIADLGMEKSIDNLIFSNFVSTTCNANLHCEFVETSDGKYFDFIHIENRELALFNECDGLDAAIKEHKIDVYDNLYDFNIYADGSTIYSGFYSDGTNNHSIELEINDTTGNRLSGYVIFAKSRNDIYFISLDNKLYNVSFDSIAYNTKLTAKLVNESKIESISYTKKEKKYIFNFEDKTQLDFYAVVNSSSFKKIMNKEAK